MNRTYFITEKNMLIVKRSFDAPVSIVWRAWTEAELLDKWWAPKPWTSETVHMEFKEGGYRLYAMVSPEGEKHWSRIDFETINMHVQFSGKDSFCDQDGTINIAAPSSLYIHRFNDKGSKTEIHSDFEYNSEDDLKKIIQMGMKEGLEIACQNLDALLLEITT